MPGVLPLKLEQEETRLILALIGALKEDSYDSLEVAAFLFNYLNEYYSDVFLDRFGVEFCGLKDSFLQIEEFARRRKMFLKGGEVNFKRASDAIVCDFRCGKLGKITLEIPEKI